MSSLNTKDLWYKNAVIYSLDLETFMDLNGDGIGDFEGLSSRLDYLHSLGVDAIWLAPFQSTQNKDNGYDIDDYYTVDTRHGTFGHFVEFIHQAKNRGIKVLIDLVVNHTSDQHPWFKNARQGPDSEYYNWYVWSEKKPEDAHKGIAFPGIQESTWSYDTQAKAWYHHTFMKHQPDLNIDNPEVRAEINRIIGFWIQLGIDGFRVDAVPFIFESKANETNATGFEYLSDMCRFMQWRKGDAVMLGEANVLPKESIRYFGKEGEAIHLLFNFYVNQYLFYALASSDTEPLKKALEETRIHYPVAQWANFLRNHDELDLRWLTTKQREEVFKQFAPEKSMQIFGRGIRRRLSPMLSTRKKTELAYSLIFSLPGIPVIRYGDEIGMGDDLDLPDRNAVRTPMQWTSEKNAGFSSADQLIHPIISHGEYSYRVVNVESQQRASSSLLNWMTSLIRLRQECVEIGHGDWKIMETGINAVLAILHVHRGSCILIIHNFDSVAHVCEVKISECAIDQLVNLMSVENVEVNEERKFQIRIEACGYKWYRGSGLAHFTEP